MSKQDPELELLPASDEPAPERGIDLFAVTLAILSEWRLGFITFVVFSVVCFLFIHSLKPQFVAKASFLPQEGRSEGGLAALFSNRGPGALYMGLLRTRSVQDRVIEDLGLMQLFHTGSRETARDILSGKTTLAEGADTIVTIEVKDESAQDAARIANAYLVALSRLNEDMGDQQSNITKKFFLRQLEQERGNLADAEAEYQRIQKQTGIVNSDTQTSIGLNAIQEARGQIAALEVQRSALLQSQTEENPQVRKLESQIAQLRINEQRLEGSTNSPLGAATPAGQMPRNNLEVVRAQRELKYHEVLVNSLSNQYETVRLNELFARSAFQNVDAAVAPEHKAWPPRKPFFLISLVFSALAGMAAIVAKLTWRRVTRDPEHRDALRRFRQAFGRR